MSMRVYPGPAPRLGIEAGRWVLGMAPHAARVAARHIEVRTTDGGVLPVQADGDLIDARPAWTFNLEPAAVRIIGRWG